jgi:hypothetical protein
MSQPTQPGQDVPDELLQLVAELFGRWYGQGLDFTDEARTLLAAVLPAHEAMVRVKVSGELFALAAQAPDTSSRRRHLLAAARLVNPPTVQDAVKAVQAMYERDIARGTS